MINNIALLLKQRKKLDRISMDKKPDLEAYIESYWQNPNNFSVSKYAEIVARFSADEFNEIATEFELKKPALQFVNYTNPKIESYENFLRELKDGKLPDQSSPLIEKNIQEMIDELKYYQSSMNQLKKSLKASEEQVQNLKKALFVRRLERTKQRDEVQRMLAEKFESALKLQEKMQDLAFKAWQLQMLNEKKGQP